MCLKSFKQKTKIHRKTKQEKENGGKNKSVQQGTPSQVYEKVLKALGGTKVTYGCWMPFDNIPMKGKFLVSSHGHITAVVDGVVRDTWESHLTKEYIDEDGILHPKRIRKVRSYWKFPENIKKLTFSNEKRHDLIFL